MIIKTCDANTRGTFYVKTEYQDSFASSLEIGTTGMNRMIHVQALVRCWTSCRQF